MASSDKAAGGPERKRALTTRQTVLLALMVAMAMGLHAVEGLVSYVSPMPGIRLGLANIVILICFSFFREGQVFLVTLLRLLLTGLILGTFLTPSFWISAGGGLLSFGAMALLNGRRAVSYTHLPIVQYIRLAKQYVLSKDGNGAVNPFLM